MDELVYMYGIDNYKACAVGIYLNVSGRMTC